MKTIADHILDILENSVRAAATLIEIIIQEDKKNDLYAVEIRDNGCGMTKKNSTMALDPFFTSRTTRRIGLGLPLLKQNARQSGGFLELFSEPGKGTTVKAIFELRHIDRPPLGDIATVLFVSISGHNRIVFIYRHSTGKGSYILSSGELKKAIGEIPLNNAEMRDGIIEMINNNLDDIAAIR